MLNFEANLRHFPSHFNSNSYGNIPEYWECELIEVPKELGLKSVGNLSIYGTSQESDKDAIADLVIQLQNNGWNGTLKVNR